jgi:hypothetical protein
LSADQFQFFYEFQTTASLKLKANLTALRDDAKLELRDAAGQTLVTSDRPGRKPEVLLRLLQPGTYYLKVTKVGEVGTRFKLNAQLLKPAKRDLRPVTPPADMPVDERRDDDGPTSLVR